MLSAACMARPGRQAMSRGEEPPLCSDAIIFTGVEHHGCSREAALLHSSSKKTLGVFAWPRSPYGYY